MINPLLEGLKRPSLKHFHNDKCLYREEPIPRSEYFESRLISTIEEAGIQDGFKITLFSGRIAGGYNEFVHIDHVVHADIEIGDVYLISHGFNKFFDRRGAWIEIKNESDKQRLIDIMKNPRDPRKIMLGDARVILGHVGTAGCTVSYSTTLDCLL